VVAVRSVDFGEGDLSNGPLVGYDLDQFCTCQTDGDSCKEPDFASADHCDGPGGRDNAVAQLFKFASTFDSGFSSQAISGDAENGNSTVLLRVRNYNGKANDTQVSLALYASPGLGEDPCWPAGMPPAWNGADRWQIDSLTLGVGGGGGSPTGAGGASCAGASGYDLDQPAYRDDEAYVTDFRVVANLPNAGLVVNTGDTLTPIKLVAGAVSGRLEQVGGAWAMREGLITGRWRLTDVFAAIGTFTSGGDALCTDNAVYPLLKNGICQFPDIASELGGPTTPCDSLSLGMAFDSEPAELGIVIEAGPATVMPCPPETDPANDSCETL
jgi:hypothetical protein